MTKEFEHARLALERFKVLVTTTFQPVLRAITKNPKLNVEPHESMAATDGKTVWLPIPWALGETTLRHDVGLCGRRDPTTLTMLCEACKSHDKTSATLFHESAHIVHDSFVEVPLTSVEKMAKAILDTDMEWGKARKTDTEAAIEAAVRVDQEFLPPLDNAVEDTFVNRRLYEARPGVEPCMISFSREIFIEGIKKLDGEKFYWKDAPEGMQAIMVVYMLGAGLRDLIESTLAEPVHVVADDKTVVGLVDSIEERLTAEDRLECSMLILKRLRELGFCPPSGKRDPKAKEDGEGEGDGGEGEGEGEDGEGLSKEMREAIGKALKAMRKLMGHEGEPMFPEDKPESGEGEPSDPKEAEKVHREALKRKKIIESLGKAIAQEGFDEESELDRGLRHREVTGRKERDIAPSASVIEPSLAELQVVFAHNRKIGIEGDLRAGPKLDTKHLHRIGTDDLRIFGRVERPKKRDWFAVIGLDCSGSTSGGAITHITQAGGALAEMLNRLRIDFEVYGHSGDYEHLAIFDVKTPGQPWNDEARSRLARLGSYSANLDGHTMEFYRKRCEASRATDKIILYFTDGAMPAENYEEELSILQREIAYCKRPDKNIHVLGIGYRCDDPKRHGLDTIRFDSGTDIPMIVKGLKDRIVHKRPGV